MPTYQTHEEKTSHSSYPWCFLFGHCMVLSRCKVPRRRWIYEYMGIYNWYIIVPIMIYWEYMELRNSTREEISMHSMALSWFQLTIRNVPTSFWRHFRPYSIHYVTISTFRFCYVSFNFLWNRCNHGEAKTIKIRFNFEGFSPNSSDSSNVVQPHHPASAVPWTSLQTLWRQHLGRWMSLMVGQWGNGLVSHQL